MLYNQYVFPYVVRISRSFSCCAERTEPTLLDIDRSCVLGYKLVKIVCGSKRIIKPVLHQNCNTILYSLSLVYLIILSVVARFM